MATLGQHLQSGSLGGTQGTIGVYQRVSPSGKTWFQYRFQMPGTAGTFISPTQIAKEYGAAFVAKLRNAVGMALNKLNVSTKVFDVGTFHAPKYKSPLDVYRKYGVTAQAQPWLFNTGALFLGQVEGGFSVSGQYGQVLAVLQRAEVFEQYGPTAIDSAVKQEMATLLHGLVEALRGIAAEVVNKNVYNVKVGTHISKPEKGGTFRRKRKYLSEYLREVSYLANSFPPYSRTGNLLAAAQQGIREIGGNAIIIGIDEELATKNDPTEGFNLSAGARYAMFVEHGHRVVVPDHKGQIHDTGNYVAERPFMAEIIEKCKEFMTSFMLSLSSVGLSSALGDMVFSWITNVRSSVTTGRYGQISDMRFIKPTAVEEAGGIYNQAVVQTPYTSPKFYREWF